MMRIAIVAESFLPQVNGVVRMLLEFVRYLDRHGHQALIFAPGDGPSQVAGFPVRRVTGLPLPLYPQVILSPLSVGMYPELRRWQPDIIHLASPFLLGRQGVLVGNRLEVPVMAHFQTDIPSYARAYHLGGLAAIATRYLVTLHNRCATTFCPTSSVAAMVRRWGVRRVAVVGRGVDSRRFHPDHRSPATRRRLGASDQDHILLYVGRLSAEKNLGYLVAAAMALPACRLVVVGDGPERVALQRQMPDNVVFTGTLVGDELAAVYAAADVFIFPSVTETFGQVVQEAMASGLPVVGMRAGGIQDIIQHGATGLLCRPDQPHDWLAAIRYLLGSLRTRQAMGTQARRYAENQSWEQVFDSLMTYYLQAREEGGSHDGTAFCHQQGRSAHAHEHV